MRAAVPIGEAFERGEAYQDEAVRYQENGKETPHRGAVRVVVRDLCKLLGTVSPTGRRAKHSARV